ncbi:MAG TPA: methyl-accepting chemotaxis protein [Bryobacteraceae bacterium]|nr:methyl-accepting chemotaxis protein [Bryobacteraceae bacterium]
MKSFQKIRTKLLLGFGMMLALALALSYSSLSAIGKLGASLDLAVNDTAKRLELVGDMRTGFQQMRADATQTEISLINTLVGQIDKHGGPACTACHAADTVETQAHEFASVAGRLKGKIGDLRPLISTSERPSLDKIDAGIGDWLALYRKYLKLAGAGDFVAAHDIMLNQIYPLVDSMEKTANQLATHQQDLLAATSREARARVSLNRLIAFVLIGLCLLAGGGVQWIVGGVNRVLRQFACEMKSISDQVLGASHEMAASSQSLAQGASEQAASLEETSAATEQLRGATHSNTVAAEVDREVSAANQMLDEMVASMHAIRTSSDKISKIIKVIDEIAFQTNILALNAAVEAARAGQAGAGFAVVADEVRNLAQRSAQAAKDTAELIQESILRSNEGSTKLERVAEAIRQVTGSTVQVKTLVDEVETGGQEQVRGIDQIADSLVQIEQVTQRAAGEFGRERGGRRGVERAI